MPKRSDIKSILIIGAGPIIIGQACEFDYSGTQACKTLKDEGYKVILVNSNPATIMTDPGLADVTYIEPITPEFVAKIIEKERPDALLPTMGGQTALNCAKALAENGTLEKFGVEMIGARLESINKAENRQLFNDAMARIGLSVAKNAVVHTLEEARAILPQVGLPAIIRPSFTLGGTGGGIAYNREEFEQIVTSGLDASPTTEVLIDESLLGWKEYEMEVVRDKADNCIIVCSIENVDPMGVHTGDSITVAPALTLTDKEYQIMRDASLAVLREIGVDTGGSNVQFAVNPANGRMVVIEMNPRVSRSSALASKATGFPIAKVAAKLAVGYTLDEIVNDVVSGSRKDKRMSEDQAAGASAHPLIRPSAMPASFEPTIDYVVTKIPRFTFEKFPAAEPTLTTAMKSVGEVMAIGRSFQESMQKALRSMETGLTGFNDQPGDADTLRSQLSVPTPQRLLQVAQALRLGITPEEVNRITKFDPWFVAQIHGIVQAEKDVLALGEPDALDAAHMLRLKRMGFSDARLAALLGGRKPAEIAARRESLGVVPVYKRVDTCAAEFESATPYMYSTYEAASSMVQVASGSPATCNLQPVTHCEAMPSDKRKIIILGGGPNRIGQGIEFDYCCVHASYALSEAGFETIMINCNPETVSTDYDTSDRLYFEPLTAEDVIAVARKEQENGTLVGVIVQFGGQTPLKLAHALELAGIPIIGTSPDSIDLAEDRERFQQLLHSLKLRQPENSICHNTQEVIATAEKIGYPVVVRPSYVLGGRAMAIIHDGASLKQYMQDIRQSFGDGPILIDSYLRDAIEVDVDALCDGEAVHVAGIMEHIEEAGIHSGDSACSLPAYSLGEKLLKEIEAQTVALARALKVIGLMNVQFAVKDDVIYILEVNPRASRTVPFVAKATGVQVAKIASRLMAGEKLAGQPALKTKRSFKHVAVKEAVFPFARFPGVDVILGPEMKSTGEAMGIDADFPSAFAKAQLAAGATLPREGRVFVSVKESDKEHIAGSVKQLLDMGYKVVATRGTASFLKERGLEVELVNKVREGRPHIVDMMKDGHVQLVINTTEGVKSIADSFSIRHSALLGKIPYSTTLAGSRALVHALAAIRQPGGLGVRSLQDYFK